MIIAADTRSFTDGAAGDFLLENLLRIAAGQPAHQFILFTAHPLADTGKNITTVVSGRLPEHALLWNLWFNYKLPQLLKKHRAAIFIGAGYISTTTAIPQLLLVSSLQFQNKTKQRFFKKWMPVFCMKASGVVTLSHEHKNIIIKEQRLVATKVTVVYPTADPMCAPIGWEEKEAVKATYTEGKEYFFYTGKLDAASHLIALVKAFSFFKKRQKSNMQLVIAAPAVDNNNKFLQSLETYKYRNEVKLLFGAERVKLCSLTAAAYALVDINGSVLGSPAINALQSAVPVIVPGNAIMRDFFKDAALYTDMDSFENIAEQLMLVFKDENKRNSLVENGKRHLQKFQPAGNAASLWEAVLKSAVYIGMGAGGAFGNLSDNSIQA